MRERLPDKHHALKVIMHIFFTHSHCPGRRGGADQGQNILATYIAERLGHTEPKLARLVGRKEATNEDAREPRDERLLPR